MKLMINKCEFDITEKDLEKSLLDYIRYNAGLTGAKNGCGIGMCGACTVLVDDRPVRACKKKVCDVLHCNILTIEGLVDDNGALHPLQQAFIDNGAIQCGFCTPGMVLTAHALLLQNAHPSREQIRAALKGNLCRCTGYQQIVDAIEYAAQFYS